MRGDESLQSFCAHKRRIAGKNQSKFRAAEGSLSDLDSVTRAILRLLQNGGSPQRLDDCGHLLCLMTHDNDRLARSERLAGANDMLHQGASARLVQDFREARLKASTLSRSEDNYS